MLSKVVGRLKRLDIKQRTSAVILILVVAVVAAYMLWPPQRSTTAFCKIYKEEDAKAKRGEYSSSDYAKYAEIYGRLEKVAPDEIHPDVKVVRQVFQKMDKDPSQAFGAGLSGLGAEANVERWAATNCK